LAAIDIPSGMAAHIACIVIFSDEPDDEWNIVNKYGIDLGIKLCHLNSLLPLTVLSAAAR